MKTKYNKRKYKMQSGVQQIYNDSPDYSDAFRIRDEQNAKRQMGSGLARTGLDIAGTAIGVPGLGGIAEGVGSLSDALLTDAKGNYKNKFAESASFYLNPLKTAGTALSALTGDKTAAADLWNKVPVTQLLSGIGIKNPFGKTSQEKVKEEAKKEEERKELANRKANYYGSYKDVASTDVQASMAKRGKYKVKTKQPRMIETEGREPIFSPKKADGTRDLLYYNPNDPTHEEGGVKAVVMPRNKYNTGVSNLMPRRSKVSLLGSGNMAVGAKQVKVDDLNTAAFSQNLTGSTPANVANKFIQPMAGIQQVARNIPEARRKEKQNTPRSHKKVNPDLNKIVDPSMLYEMKPPPPRSTFNTKNDFNKGGKYIKVYKDGAKSVSLAFSRGEKDPKGGLTQKGVDKYNRATGGNLKMAVTTPPSKLKAGSKAANRRKSFCSRMKGMKSKLTSAKTANDPNSRINKSLRKWNC